MALVVTAFFCATAVCAEENDALKLETVRARGYSNATILVAGIRNHSPAPIRAFRATLFALNDFDEAERVCEIEFSSDSGFMTSRGPTRGHVIQPGETIFFVVTTNEDGTVRTQFTREDLPFAPARGRFKLALAKAVTAAASELVREGPGDSVAATPAIQNRQLPVSQPKATEPQRETLYYIPGTDLNVRTGPGANSPISVKLPGGFEGIRITGASVMNDTTEWVPIAFGDQSGWVARRYLEPQ